jgi:2-phosphoglycolate phosphatase
MNPDWISQINTVIFDLDGTLIDSTEAIIESTNQALKVMGKPLLPPDFIRSKIGYRLEDAIGDWAESEKRELMRLIHDYYHAVCLEKTWPMDGAHETIVHLKDSGFRMGVATGKKRELSTMILRHLELLPFLEAVVGSDDVHRMKPDPETLFKVLNHLNMPPERAVYVGDTVIDVQASRRAGIRCIAVLGGTDSLEDIRAEKPDHIIHNLRELQGIFLNPPQPGPLSTRCN